MRSVMFRRAFSSLSKDIHIPCPVPLASQERATNIMKTGSMFRYNGAESELARVEDKLRNYTGHKYAVGVNSCGSALFLSLKAAGISDRQRVLTNAFTFSAVPSAILHAGGEPVLVESTKDLVLDLDDFEKAAMESGAKTALVSHMRGRMCDMEALGQLCDDLGIYLIEDCAHSLGSKFNGTPAGHTGVSAGVSSQSYKILNSGEGGFLLTNSDEVAAFTICAAGCYETNYLKHPNMSPEMHELIREMKPGIPNYSLRMHNVTAAMLNAQIDTIEERKGKYLRRFYEMESFLESIPWFEVPKQHQKVEFVGDTVQFRMAGFTDGQVQGFLQSCRGKGLPINTFGALDNARNFETWNFIPCRERIIRTQAMIKDVVDLRLPLRYTNEDFAVVRRIILKAVEAVVEVDINDVLPQIVGDHRMVRVKESDV